MPTQNSDVINGNKIISEFMGGKLKYYNISNEPYYQMPNKEQWMPERLVYHTSWDWLIPVVEKANKICSENGYDLSNRSREQEHFENPIDNPLHWKSCSYHSITLSTNINMVWQACVDFINWYNNSQIKNSINHFSFISVNIPRWMVNGCHV